MSPATAEREVVITDPLGLHARPAATFAERATRHACAVTLAKAGREVDAKSVLLVLTLDVRQGDRVVLRAAGDDAQHAVDDLAVLIGSG